MSDLRPIALCNVPYKILTKILANRLKPIFSSAISESQSAFIEGRSINDNIIVAFETQHYIKCRRQGRNGVVALKADMSKAFDRVEWTFLSGIMDKLGFCNKWIDWIMSCVSTISLNILSNGSEVGRIYPQRGLRQGDPISPYLFILITEGLSALMRRAESRGVLNGIVVSRRAPKVSHLLFADDSYFFFNANVEEATAFMNIMNLYSKASGQVMNPDKSSIQFSPNVDIITRNRVEGILGVKTGRVGNYLGLPSMEGRNKREILGFIKSRMINKIQGWGHIFLSRAGREVLLKSIIQAIPTYTMGVFLLPQTLVKEVEVIMNSFWWKGKLGRGSGIHWKSWDRLSIPKWWGGMGFRKMREFNLALLSRQSWNFVCNPTSLAARVIKARYYPNSSFLEASRGSNPSYIWSSLLETKDIIRRGTRWRVGNGSSIHIWGDNWLPDNLNAKVTTPQYPLMLNATVDYLLQNDGLDWDHEIIEEIFNPRDARLIMSIPISRNRPANKTIWAFESNGRFSVKSCYKELVGVLPANGLNCGTSSFPLK